MNKDASDKKVDKSKLTLRLSTRSIEKAKKIAAERNISVSHLVEQYFDLLAIAEHKKMSASEELGNRTKYLTGLLNRDQDSQ